MTSTEPTAAFTVVGDGIAVHPLGHVATPARPKPTAADVKRAEAVRFIESAQNQVARARRALIAAGEDPSGENRILRDLDRELVWLCG